MDKDKLNMAKNVEFYEGRPIFQANNSKELAAVVAEYAGEVKPQGGWS